LLGTKVIIDLDYAALKYLFFFFFSFAPRKDAKSHIEIRDKKDSENMVIDHLSRKTMDYTEDARPILETFPDEQLMHIAHNPAPWFADIVNYLVTG
jgi:hypothetical protein